MISKSYNLKFVEKSDGDCNDKLVYLLQVVEANSNAIIVASEVYLSDFAYEEMQNAATFSLFALQKLQSVVKEQIVVLTLIVEEGGAFFNRAIVLHQGQIIHTQTKVKLFGLGNEDKHFKAGRVDEIVTFEVAGLKVGILICFELRFKEFWSVLQGCDLIIIPAKWGKLRENHFKILSQALAVINQCYVAALSCGDESIADVALLWSPNGETTVNLETKEIAKMRKYISVR